MRVDQKPDPTEFKRQALALLSQLYPLPVEPIFERLTTALQAVRGFLPDSYASHPQTKEMPEHEAILITYGDSISREGKPSLMTLKNFLEQKLGNAIPVVHLLPCFPYSSDDGFSVIDYQQINPTLGTWADVAELNQSYDLMLDAVINHISRHSAWFQGFLRGQAPEKDYFIEANPGLDYSMVFRPRALPLLTQVETANGSPYVWTTFSSDQIDLNYQNPELMIRMMEIMLGYARSGASLIRLDAIAYCWKKLGTSCLSLPETHALVKLIRLCLDYYAPGTRIITETNVPHAENISYFGAGDEANLVYQFALPPLVFFSFRSGSAEKLTRWLTQLEEPPADCRYFNFLSSHDGIGVTPVAKILDPDEKKLLESWTLESGGKISYKDLGNGTHVPYELNVNYLDAMAALEESDQVRIERFISAETLLISLKGVPGIYIHSLLGSRNNYAEMHATGISRRINRGSIDLDRLQEELEPGGYRQPVFDELRRRLQLRMAHAALGVDATQEVLSLDPRLVSFIRQSVDQKAPEKMLVLVNVSNDFVEVGMPFAGWDLLAGERVESATAVPPRSSRWIVLDE